MSPEGLWKSGLQRLMSQFLLVLQVKVKEVEEAVGRGAWPGMEGSGQAPTYPEILIPKFCGHFLCQLQLCRAVDTSVAPKPRLKPRELRKKKTRI